MQLEKNFYLKEFKCKDGTQVPADLLDSVSKLAKNLQVLRDEIGRPIIIISGYRSPRYNKRIGGAKKSQHLLAKAADVVVPGMDARDVWKIILKLIKEGRMVKGGVGIYPDFVHYDIRGRNARWGSYKK